MAGTLKQRGLGDAYHTNLRVNGVPLVDVLIGRRLQLGQGDRLAKDGHQVSPSGQQRTPPKVAPKMHDPFQASRAKAQYCYNSSSTALELYTYSICTSKP